MAPNQTDPARLLSAWLAASPEDAPAAEAAYFASLHDYTHADAAGDLPAVLTTGIAPEDLARYAASGAEALEVARLCARETVRP